VAFTVGHSGARKVIKVRAATPPPVTRGGECGAVTGC
jgi:hypothetical protein